MKILAVGAHPDDVALYCGGSLIRAVDEGHTVRVVVATGGQSRKGAREDEESAANKFIGVEQTYFLGFQDGKLGHNLDFVQKMDEIVKEYNPDIVLSHNSKDHHQDHQSVYHAVKSASREWTFSWVVYESYDVRNEFTPNLFVDITKYYENKKKLLKIFSSQQDRWYFKDAIVEARSLGSKAGQYVEKFNIQYLSI